MKLCNSYVSVIIINSGIKELFLIYLCIKLIIIHSIISVRRLYIMSINDQYINPVSCVISHKTEHHGSPCGLSVKLFNVLMLR